jgi:alkylation response protein AidB-like acyl-CoA dehydrogenase
VATVAFPTRRGHRVTGCKLVTADALRADWFLVLARTGEPGPDPTSLSCLILPARAPGLTLEVADGGARLALVGVRGGESALVGRVGEGWAVAVATLANDGGPAGTGRIAAMRLRLARLVAEVVALDLAPGHPLACALTRLHGAVEGLGRQALRTLRNEAAGIRSVGGLASGAHDEAVVCAEASLADLVTQVAELQVARGRPPRMTSNDAAWRAGRIRGGSYQGLRPVGPAAAGDLGP